MPQSKGLMLISSKSFYLGNGKITEDTVKLAGFEVDPTRNPLILQKIVLLVLCLFSPSKAALIEKLFIALTGLGEAD
jgi:hypothetical protein